jgi:hypothetical protein
LPEDGEVYDDLSIHHVDEDLDANGADLGPVTEGGAAADEGGIDEAVVPNFMVEELELERLQSCVDDANNDNYDHVPLQPAPLPANHLPMTSLRRTPLSEFNRSQTLLSLACPTLYSYGAVDFIEVRQRQPAYSQYLMHTMKWHNGRFAMHHTFRFITLNTLIRQQSHSYSNYYVKKSDSSRITLEQLEEVLSRPDAQRSVALLNAIVRIGSSLKGTRPF